MTRIRMGLVPGLLLALALALAIGACGGDGGNSNDGVASLGDGKATTTTGPGNSGKDFKQQMLAYARCLRQHGIDMPDPKFDAQGHMAMQLPSGVGPDDPKFKAADQACQQYAPGGGGGRVDSGPQGPGGG
jgi:hypothetical protein